MADGAHPWTPSSWRHRRALQQPDYNEPHAARAVLEQIQLAGPLVSPEECLALRQACAEAAVGEAFIVQAGDCAESLQSEPGPAANRMRVLIDQLLEVVGGKTVAIARIAGQFAKPRSHPNETRDEATLPAYRGDAVNGLDFDAASRAHDPARLLAAYRHSAATAKYLRQGRPRLFTSHEALILPYEEALAISDAEGRWWAGSGHMLWIGDRTRQVGGAHVAFASGIENVVGVKCGPSIDADELIRLAQALDPQRKLGKLVLIGRFGASRIERCLPVLLRAARQEGFAAGWMIDPMHGNTRHESGRKQRRLSDMSAEIELFFGICDSEGVSPAGIHIEVSAEPVVECIGADGRDPMAAFPCDPRLNKAQARTLVALAASLQNVPAEA